MLVRAVMIFFLSFNVMAQSLTDGLGATPSSSQNAANANNEIAQLGPFAVGYEFCQKIQAIAPILQAYSSIQWPVIGAPGLTFGLVQNESALMKICDFLVQLQSLDTEGAIFFTARKLNEITGNKWDSHLNQAEQTWRISNSLYDFKSGKGRKGALTSAQTHRDLVAFADSTAKWYQTSVGPEDQRQDPSTAVGVESKAERKKELEKVANLAYQRAILKEATNCGTVDKKDIKNDYQKKYSKEVTPNYQIKKETEETVLFYKQTLLKMGTDFIETVSEMEEYTSRLNNIIEQSYSYAVKGYGKTDVVRKVPTGKMKKITHPDGRVSTEPETKDEISKREYQKIRVKTNPTLVKEFKDKYVPAWEKYISSQLLSTGSFGLFDDKRGRIEEKYRSYNFECSEIKLSRTLTIDNRNDPQYYPELQKAQEECRDNLKKRGIDKNTFKNLLDKYIVYLDQDLKKGKVAQAKIWTFESLYLGFMPIKEEKTKASSAQKEEERQLRSIQASQASCRPDYTPAEMQKLSLELKNIETEMIEQIVKGEAKSNMMKEEELRAKQRDSKEINEKNEKSQEAIKNKPRSVTPGVDIKVIRGV